MAQYIDMEGRVKRNQALIYLCIEDNITVWQIKHYAKFTDRDLKKAVEKFLNGNWKDEVKSFFICISHPVGDIQLSEEILVQSDILKAAEIEFGVLDSNHLHGIATKCPQIIQDYFGEAWVKALGLSGNIQSITTKVPFKHVGELQNKGEEFECAQFIDALPDIVYWIRNLERKQGSFWLQTSTDKFYPDFICLLKSGQYLAVEYKGADRYTNNDSKEKRCIGEVWEKRSNGRCLFVMPNGKDLVAIKNKIVYGIKTYAGKLL